MRLFAVLAAALVLAACSTDPDVPADLERRVSLFVEDGNCRGLQAEFDNAVAADELGYIDEQMADLGCYG